MGTTTVSQNICETPKRRHVRWRGRTLKGFSAEYAYSDPLAPMRRGERGEEEERRKGDILTGN